MRKPLETNNRTQNTHTKTIRPVGANNGHHTHHPSHQSANPSHRSETHAVDLKPSRFDTHRSKPIQKKSLPEPPSKLPMINRSTVSNPNTQPRPKHWTQPRPTTPLSTDHSPKKKKKSTTTTVTHAKNHNHHWPTPSPMPKKKKRQPRNPPSEERREQMEKQRRKREKRTEIMK